MVKRLHWTDMGMCLDVAPDNRSLYVTASDYDTAHARIRELEARELALTKFAEFCDYHHRSCDGLKGQHLECDCGYTSARDELRAALASQSDRSEDSTNHKGP